MATRTDWDRLRLGIDLLSKAVAKEILRYPAPIPACDTQFNHLLELRRVLPMELTRLDIAEESRQISVAEYIRASPCRETLAALLEEPGSSIDC